MSIEFMAFNGNDDEVAAIKKTIAAINKLGERESSAEFEVALAEVEAMPAKSDARESSGDPARKYLGVSRRSPATEISPLSADETDEQPF